MQRMKRHRLTFVLLTALAGLTFPTLAARLTPVDSRLAPCLFVWTDNATVNDSTSLLAWNRRRCRRSETASPSKEFPHFTICGSFDGVESHENDARFAARSTPHGSVPLAPQDDRTPMLA
jgi:hypothetical protein